MQDRFSSTFASGERPPLLPRVVGVAQLMSAARKGDVAGVLRASLNGINVATATDSCGRGAAHLAALNGFPDVIRVLLSLMGRGHAAFNAIDVHGNTPLHFAAHSFPFQGRDVVVALLDAGARADVKDAQGRTPVQIARENGNIPVVEVLEDREQRAGA